MKILPQAAHPGENNMDSRKRMFLVILAAELLTAMLYAYGIAPGLAAMHNDMHVYIPILLFLVSGFFLIFMSTCLYGYMKIRKQTNWRVILPFFIILASIVIWALILCLIGYNTDCCVGG